MNINQQKKSGLSAFGGVYTPSILTILGVIMYLRFGWVVGNVGLLGTLIIVTLSNVITFLTALSVCAIATDRVVRAGGAYYMISRSLGIETGGAVGIPLYFAQALSVSLYTLGFAESVIMIFPQLGDSQLYIALATTIAVGILALTSAEIAIKAQYFIMVAIVLSLVSFFFGKPIEVTEIEWWNTTDESFWTVFAVFFPAVTGIMAGVNMSGDLKDPTTALPKGTLYAVGTGYIIYMIIPIFLSLWASSGTLLNEDNFVMAQMSRWSWAIALGVWGATLSSAIGSILGAPRILQALARDQIFPKSWSFLGKGSGKEDEPRLGTVVTLIIAVLAVCLADLDLIAPVLSMFFLTTYLVLNASAGIESFLQLPSFRPTFKVHWSLSLLGALGCLGVMFLINAFATVIAAVVVLAIYFYLQRQELQVTWGDSRRGIWMAFLRTGIYQIDHFPDAKNWRPHILAFSRNPQEDKPLIELADSFNHKGLLTVAKIVPEGEDYHEKNRLQQEIKESLEKDNIETLVKVISTNSKFPIIPQVVETYGIGPLIPNTVLLGDSRASYLGDMFEYEQYCQMVSQLHSLKRNIIILKDNPHRQFGNYERIDIWWGGMKANGSLMLLLAYLLKYDWNWRKAKVFLKLIVPNINSKQIAEKNIYNYIKKLNIDLIPEVIVSQGKSFEMNLREHSQDADLIFLGLAESAQNFVKYYSEQQRKTDNLPSIAFVMAANDFPFEEVLQKN